MMIVFNKSFLLGFENSENREDTILRFNILYCKTFENFHNFWINSEYKIDIMNFNIALKNYFRDNIKEILK